MPLPAGTRLGPYQIVAALGAGGMGEVYRARDTRLDRTVAIKVLHPSLALDPEFRDRFGREARVISALDHPHVCALHDVGERDGAPYLVMPCLDGETLADRLARAGALPVPESLAVGAAIADGLAAAHRRGIVHRDLKPANVMLTSSGVKLLDFGLAKPQPVAVPAAAETRPKTLTAQGTLLGTLQYMAPEQLEGREADARTDVWALGCVLYEMLTGVRAFDGQSQASVIGSILKDQPPPVSRAAALSPPALDRLVAKCLSKDPDGRWHSAVDLRDELRWVAEPGVTNASAAVASRGGRGVAVAAAAVLLVVLASAAMLWTDPGPNPPDAGVSRLSVVLPPDVGFDGSPVLSPDGSRMVFMGRMGGRSALWVRDFESLAPRILPGTEEAVLPFWSPDGRSIGFFTNGRLKRVGADGTGLQTIADAPNGRGGTWNRDGIILFAPNVADGLFRVSASGGPVERVTTVDAARGDNTHRFPAFMPDGRRFVFRIRSGVRAYTGAYLASLDDPSPQWLLQADSNVVIGPAHLVFARESTLFAQAFDFDKGQALGEPAAVASDIGYDVTTVQGSFSVSDTGLLAYYPAGSDGRVGAGYQLTWYDRSGRRLGTVGGSGLVFNPVLSPGGRLVAFDRVVAQTGTRNVWLADLQRNLESRFTFSTAVDASAVWSRDGRSIIFVSSRDGPQQLFRKELSGEERRLTAVQGGFTTPTSWSPDERFIVVQKTALDTRNDVWIVDLQDGATAKPFIATPFEERQAQFSPDGRWIAYASDESGRYEVYVVSFPLGSDKLRVSVDGGIQPQWRADGRELFFLSTDQRVMAATVTIDGNTLVASAPQALFAVTTYGSIPNRNDFTPDRAGQRFLVATRELAGLTAPVVIVRNWPALLRR